jgi:signal peptidase I
MTDSEPQHPGRDTGPGISQTTSMLSVTPQSDGVTTTGTKPERKRSSALREIIETALLALLIFVLVRAFVLNFKVDGSSMEPTFETGEMLLVNRNAYRSLDAWDVIDWIPGVDERHGTPLLDFGDPERGDVIVFTPPPPGLDKPYIKRVIGMPGDTVEVRNEGVFVNGIQLDEAYVGGKPSICQPSWDYCNTPVIIPDGTVYVMGDNRTDSEDSRFFGPVPAENIIGKAWIVYWPTEVWGPVKHPDYPETGS